MRQGTARQPGTRGSQNSAACADPASSSPRPSPHEAKPSARLQQRRQGGRLALRGHHQLELSQAAGQLVAVVVCAGTGGTGCSTGRRRLKRQDRNNRAGQPTKAAQGGVCVGWPPSPNRSAAAGVWVHPSLVPQAGAHRNSGLRGTHMPPLADKNACMHPTPTQATAECACSQACGSRPPVLVAM
jgi:hypothetical protein